MKIKTQIRSGMGLGDCMANIAQALGLDEMAKKYEEISGQSCGCEKRKEILNRIVPEL